MTEEYNPNDLWDRLFFVRVPYLDAVNLDFLKKHGTYITGNQGIDKNNVNSWISTYINIDRMLDYYRDGVCISIIRYEDTKVIYEIIEKHLLFWKEQLTYQLGGTKPPIQDLIDLDRFAHLIYDKAKYIMVDDPADTPISRLVRSKFKYDPFVNIEKDKEPEVKDRGTELADFLRAKTSDYRGYNDDI